MGRNIVVCCDGTANEFAADRTNVLKLFFTLVHDPQRQVAFYHPGVGTMEPPGAHTPLRRRAARLLGQAVGWGLENDIRNVYAFLMSNFRADDHLYMFGFSRGAYTVRAVAALLHMYGLIRAGNEPLIPYAIRMMTGVDKISNEEAAALNQAFRLADDFKEHFSAGDCKPHFVGIWDTVSSVGWIANPLSLPYTANNPDINIGRHAVSIDERRAFFRSNLWRPATHGGPRDVKQVWFPGVHSDVGGGYPEAESGLAKISLRWMLREATSAGLLCDEAKVALVLGEAGGGYAKPDPAAKMHESLTGFWHLAELMPKRYYNRRKDRDEWRINRWRRRKIPPNSLIHQSAFDRGEEYRRLLPDDAVFVS
jgi:uncharacterized protein (DUF2235 family)